MDTIFDNLAAIAGPENVRQAEPLRLHTTFRTGGPADYFVLPQNEDQICALVTFCKNNGQPFYIIGNGSNLLVSDKGYRGVIIQLYQNQSIIQTDGTRITAQAGALLSKIAATAQKAGLTGFEFAAGIPGTIGGACIMNAGAYGGEIKDVLSSVKVLRNNGTVSVLPAEKLDLGYRTSSLSADQDIVLSATLSLQPGDSAAIMEEMRLLAEQRRSKQPLEYASAGSTFKRPEGFFAGKLIQDAGLRGYCIGDAAVSEKHCGFIVNKGNASSSDIWKVILHVREEVQRQFGVCLHTEVKFLGEF